MTKRLFLFLLFTFPWLSFTKENEAFSNTVQADPVKASMEEDEENDIVGLFHMEGRMPDNLDVLLKELNNALYRRMARNMDTTAKADRVEAELFDSTEKAPLTKRDIDKMDLLPLQSKTNICRRHRKKKTKVPTAHRVKGLLSKDEKDKYDRVIGMLSKYETINNNEMDIPHKRKHQW